MKAGIWIGMGVLLILLATGVNATSVRFVDDFNKYEANYEVVSLTNNIHPWTINYNANSLTIDPTDVRDSNASIHVDVNRAIDFPQTRVSIATTTRPTNISDFNANGSVYYWLFIDGNAEHFSQYGVDLRIGALTNYYFYRVFGGAGDTAFNTGWNLVKFDLNHALITIGTPNLTRVTWMEMSASEAVGGPDINFNVNKVWAEKQTNAFDGRWIQGRVNGKPMGWGMPVAEEKEYAMNLSNTEGMNDGIGKKARIFIPTLGSSNGVQSSTREINANVNVKQATVKGSTKLLFDYVDEDNYNSVFIDDTNYPATTIGVEDVNNGVRTFTETAFAFTNDTYYNVKMEVKANNSVNVYVNNSLVHVGTVSRRDGEMGVGVEDGRARFKNYRALLP